MTGSSDLNYVTLRVVRGLSCISQFKCISNTAALQMGDVSYVSPCNGIGCTAKQMCYLFCARYRSDICYRLITRGAGGRVATRGACLHGYTVTKTVSTSDYCGCHDDK